VYWQGNFTVGVENTKLKKRKKCLKRANTPKEVSKTGKRGRRTKMRRGGSMGIKLTSLLIFKEGKAREKRRLVGNDRKQEARRALSPGTANRGGTSLRKKSSGGLSDVGQERTFSQRKS